MTDSGAVIALLTDFGLQDSYVGILKGVIAGIEPAARTVNLTHGIAPGAILSGQIALSIAVPYFPANTIFLGVVDPGVGTGRRPIAVASDGYRFVGPDNGLFTPWLHGSYEAVELTSPRHRLLSVSSTFHGRDIFAPAAAYLARGVPLGDLGPAITDPILLSLPASELQPDGTMAGQVVHVDHFGNLITNIEPHGPGVALIDGVPERLPLVETYGSAPSGALVALVGSEGKLELAVRDGSAAARLGAEVGHRVRWQVI